MHNQEFDLAMLPRRTCGMTPELMNKLRNGCVWVCREKFANGFVACEDQKCSGKGVLPFIRARLGIIKAKLGL